MLRIMQGDALSVPIRVALQDVIVVPDMVKSVEVLIDTLSKVYPGEVTFDESNKVWLLPLSQEETFSFSPNQQPIQVRVKFRDDSVIGLGDMCLQVLPSSSKVVL